MLLIHENYGDRRWGLPGGASEAGESPAETAAREAFEETGVHVRTGDVVGTYVIDVSPPFVVTVFEAEITDGTAHVPPTGEIAALGWFAPNDVPYPMTNTLPAVLADLRTGERGRRRHVPNRFWPRVPFDVPSYVEKVRTEPCFVCGVIRDRTHHVVFENDLCIAFLNRFPTVYGYTLFAPKAHHTAVTGDFTEDAYVELQRHLYRVAEAIRAETATERLYLMSLGSRQGNPHVHWHIAPLPPGVPYDEQQFEALRAENGILEIPHDVQEAFAARVRARLRASSGSN